VTGIKNPNEDTGGGRDVPLGYFEFERNRAGVIFVTNATIAAEAFHRLTDTNYYFIVNVFSGRHVFANNILDGGYAVGQIGNAIKAPVRAQLDTVSVCPKLPWGARPPRAQFFAPSRKTS
jgi:hypothetical protein